MGIGHRRAVLGAVVAAAALVAPAGVSADVDQPVMPDVGRPFAPVFEGLVYGDLLLIGNSNLRSAGGWRTDVAADVDGDDTVMCVEVPGTDRPAERRLCTDNSSSAELDLPAGARVIAARLYVETSLGRRAGAATAAVDGPASPAVALPATRSTAASPAKLYEAVAGTGPGAVLRSAVWDVTEYVAAGGAGRYTVADIASQRAGPYLPYASWAMVVAYELDPAVAIDDVADPGRFAPRVLSWHDGFQLAERGSVDVTVPNVDVSAGRLPFGKSLHVVAGGRPGQNDNLLLGGEPLGNNNSPGDSPPPGDLTIGRDPACNAVTDVQNDSICVLGTNVATKTPATLLSTSDGRTPTSGSGVDIDVIRIPDRHLRTVGSRPTLRVRASADDALAPVVLAVSIDVPREAP
jgi:hypothetical protein